MKIVLVIEGDEATRNALHDLLLLEWPHLTILTTKTGQEGLQVALHAQVDLVIFEGNCVHSKGMSGDVLARQLRQIPAMKTTPLIAVTAPNLRNQTITTGLAPYCNAWLLKPFSAERLIRVVSPFTYAYS